MCQPAGMLNFAHWRGQQSDETRRPDQMIIVVRLSGAKMVRVRFKLCMAERMRMCQPAGMLNFVLTTMSASNAILVDGGQGCD